MTAASRVIDNYRTKLEKIPNKLYVQSGLYNITCLFNKTMVIVCVLLVCKLSLMISFRSEYKGGYGAYCHHVCFSMLFRLSESYENM